MPTPEPLYALVICDISGYTRFITGQKARSHGFVIVGQLLRSVLRAVSPTLRLAKIEGDAVFLYRPLPADPARQAAALQEVLHACDRAFLHFTERRKELIQANLCACEACMGTGELDLKAIVSSGEVLEQRIGSHRELVGVEVIRVHRLLKNSVPATCYLLLTEPTAARLGNLVLPESTLMEEEHAELGPCTVRVYAPPLGLTPPLATRSYQGAATKAKDILTKIFLGRLRQFGLLPARPAVPED